MTFKTAFTALLLTMLPVASFAMCEHDRQVQSCAEGMVWDIESSSCVKQITS